MEEIVEKGWKSIKKWKEVFAKEKTWKRKARSSMEMYIRMYTEEEKKRQKERREEGDEILLYSNGSKTTQGGGVGVVRM